MILSLMEALSQDKLEEFLAQEEARGIGPVDAVWPEEAGGRVNRCPQAPHRRPSPLRGT